MEGCLSRCSAIPASIWLYFRLMVMSFPLSLSEKMESRRYFSCEMPNSVRRSMRARPPISRGPWRISVGRVLECPTLLSIDARTLACTVLSSSSSIARAGSTYRMDGPYVVRWKVCMSCGVSRGDRRQCAYVSAFFFKVCSWVLKSPSGER